MNNVRMRAALMAGFSVVVLSACGRADYNPQKTAAPMPPIADAPLTRPAATPSADIGTTAAPLPLQPAVAALQPPPAPMTVEDRVSRLENSVTLLRDDFGAIAPAFARLNASNERVEKLLTELEAGNAKASPSKTGTKKAAKPASRPSAAKTQNPAAPAPAAVPASSGALTREDAVTALRIGEHGDRTRMVFDLSGKTRPRFTQDIDNGEHVLLVEMPDLSWKGATSGTPASPLVAGWNVQPGGAGGSTIAVQLKKNVRVRSTEFIAPDGSDPARLVIDLAPAS